MKTSSPLRSELSTWQRVAGAYRAVGLEPLLDETTTSSGYVYDDGVAALAGDAIDRHGVALHDLSHFLVAPPDRQYAPNFGLGAHPSVTEHAFKKSRLSYDAATREECAASVVNVLLAEILFGRDVAEDVAAYLCFEGDVRTDRETEHTRKILVRCGLLEKNDTGWALRWPPALAAYLAREASTS
jgi:hypothetical protein